MTAATDVLPAVRRAKHDPVALALVELERLTHETERLIRELAPPPAPRIFPARRPAESDEAEAASSDSSRAYSARCDDERGLGGGADELSRW